MATISSIGSGKTYSTINLWDAAWATGGWIGEIDNGGEMVIAGGQTIGSHSTSSTDYIILRCASGKSFRDNASAGSNALTYNASNGEALRGSNNYGAALYIQSSFVTLDGLQIQQNGFNIFRAVSFNGVSITINNCICSLKPTGGDSTKNVIGADGAATLVIRNSVAETLGGTVGNAIVQIQTGNISAYFCTFVADSVGASAAKGVFSNYYNVTLENCAIFGCTTAAQAGSTLSVTTCMTDLASPPTGFTTKTYSSQFQSTVSPWDWRTQSAADLRGAATSDSTNGATDILKTARPQGSAWDIGAFQYVSAAPAGIAGKTVFINQAINRAGTY